VISKPRFFQNKAVDMSSLADCAPTFMACTAKTLLTLYNH